VLNPDDIIELAHLTAGGHEFFPVLLGQLQADFGCKAAAIHVAAAYPITGGGPLATVGFDPDVRRACAGRWPTFLDELARYFSGQRLRSQPEDVWREEAVGAMVYHHDADRRPGLVYLRHCGRNRSRGDAEELTAPILYVR
jgi:hypothetical protein